MCDTSATGEEANIFIWLLSCLSDSMFIFFLHVEKMQYLAYRESAAHVSHKFEFGAYTQ